MARIVTPQARISYPHLFQRYAYDDDKDPKFSACFVFEDGTDISDFQKAAIAVAQEKWGDKLKGAKIKELDTQYGKAPFLVAGDLRVRLPWRGHPEAVESKGYPEGSTFVNASTDRKPGVVTQIPDPQTGKPQPLEDESKIYPGVYVKASFDLYAYNNSGNKGVGVGLGNVQYIGGGDAFAGTHVPAEDEFDTDPNAAADLSDLTDDGDDAGDDSDDGDDLSDLIGG